MSPISGSEPKINDTFWNKRPAVKESHNCFAYAMNTVETDLIKKCETDKGCNVGFPQPGYASGHSQFNKDVNKGCLDMVHRLWGDNPDIKATKFHLRCPYTTSKIFLIVDPKRDYHFLRQDPDGYWSHKPGSMDVTRIDSSGRPILRPDRALFIYKNHKEPLEYTRFCGYFCVPRDKAMMMKAEVKEGGAVALSPGPSRYRLTRRKSRNAHPL
jgi:hypothetical protein